MAYLNKFERQKFMNQILIMKALALLIKRNYQMSDNAIANQLDSAIECSEDILDLLS